MFLDGIRTDLRKDSIELESLINFHDKHFAYFRLIDPDFSSPNVISNIEIDTSLNFSALFSRGRSLVEPIQVRLVR